MKINFPALFRTPLQKYRFFFIFGNEVSVFERAISFLKQQLACRIQLKTEEEIFTHVQMPPSLFEDQASPSLTFVPHVTDKLLKRIDQLTEGTFIFTSEKARSGSKLVTYFSQSPTSLAITAYASPLTSFEFEFLVEGTNLPVPFKTRLFKTYENDYRGLLTTLEKIKLYGDVPTDHFDQFLRASNSTDELIPLIHSCLLKNLEKATTSFSALSSADLIPLLRTLSRSFQILFELMPFKKSPKTISWQGLSTPVFFKDQPIYETALGKWNGQEVRAFLETVLKLEQQVKFSALPFSSLQQKLLSILC